MPNCSLICEQDLLTFLPSSMTSNEMCTPLSPITTFLPFFSLCLLSPDKFGSMVATTAVWLLHLEGMLGCVCFLACLVGLLGLSLGFVFPRSIALSLSFVWGFGFKGFGSLVARIRWTSDRDRQPIRFSSSVMVGKEKSRGFHGIRRFLLSI